MSEIKKYKKYLNFKANPRYLRRDFIVPLYTGTEPDIVPETNVDSGMVVDPSRILPKNFTDDMPFVTDENNTEQLELADGGSVERQGFLGAGQVKPLPNQMKKIFKLRYPNKEWENLTGFQRGSFKADFSRQQKILKSIPKDYITINELAEKLGLSKESLRETRTNLAKFINEKLKPMTFGSIKGGTTESGTKTGGSVKYFKNPSPRLLSKILEMKETDFQVDTLKNKTIKNINNLYSNYLDIYKKGKLPLIEEIKNMTPGEAGVATTRLAQILDGKKFRNEGLENIRINRNIASKIFEELNKNPFGNPYRSNLYKIALDTIDQKLGNKKGTFDSLKKEAVQILRDAKIPIYNAQSKNPKGFNINEIAGVSGSARSKAAEFSQFIDIMEGELNQKQLASFQSALSRARVNIEENPATFNKQMKHINALASSFEEEYKVKLPRIRPATQVGRYYNQERLAELNKLGLDIKAASERAGYTIQMPKGAVTIQEFINNPKIKDQMIANIGCPTLVSKSIGGRVNFSNGSNCYAKGLEKIQSEELNQSERRIASQFLKEAGAAGEDVQDVFKGTKAGLRFLQDVVVGLTRPIIAANVGISAAAEGENLLRGQLNPASRLVESITFGALGGGPTEVADQMLEFGSPGTIKTINHSRTIKKFNDQIESEKNDIENANNTFAEYGIDPTNVILEKEKNIANIEKQKNEFLSNPTFALTQKDKNDFENDFKKIVRIGLDKGIEGTKKTARFTPEIQATSNEILIDRERFPNFASQLATDLRGTEIENILKPYSDIEKSIESTFIAKDPELLKIKNYYQGFKNAGDIIYNKPKPLTDEQRIEIEEIGARGGAAEGGYIDYVKEYKKYARGGRINLSDGGNGNRPKISRRGFLGFLAGAASAPFVAKLFKGKKGIQTAKIAAKVLPEAKGMPEWFNPLITKIMNEGVDISPKATRVEDIKTIKKLEIPTPDGKGTDTIIMTKYPDGSVEVDAEVLGGGAFDSPFTLTYKPPKLDIDLATGKPIKDPGSFYVVEQRPKPDYNDPGNFEIDYETMYVDDAISDIERIEKIATGKRISPQKVEQRAGARKFVESNPSEDIVNRYGDSEIEYDRMKDEGLFDETE